LQFIKMMKKYFVILFVLVGGLSACKKTTVFDANAQAVKDDAAIQAYIATNKLTNVIHDPSGMYYQIITPGTGIYPTAGSTVTVGYTGKLLDGTVFDSNASFTTSLGSVVRGWTIGLQHINKGGRILLLIPSGMGYGDNVSGSIPADSVLIFTIDMISY